MSFDASFLVALLLLILGSGCLKGNISAQVGTLYPDEAESLRERGFTIFSTGDQHRRGRRPAGDRDGGRSLWLACRLRACRRADAASRLAIYLAGARHLPGRKSAGTPNEASCRR